MFVLSEGFEFCSIGEIVEGDSKTVNLLAPSPEVEIISSPASALFDEPVTTTG